MALGYAYKGDWTREEGRHMYQLKHRLYEQYLYSGKIKLTEVTARLRLEQRFLQSESGFDFAQRTRAFVSFQIPLAANHDFTQGLYFKIQDELFLNVQNKKNVNNSIFDQNRALVAPGYRFSKKLEVDLGYMYRSIKEEEERFRDNIFQLMFTTSL